MSQEIIRAVMEKIEANQARQDKLLEKRLAQMKAELAAMIKEEVRAAMGQKPQECSYDRAPSMELSMIPVRGAVVDKTMARSVYNEVAQELNKKLIPRVAGIMRWHEMQLEDGAQIVHDYRMGVHSGGNLLTDAGGASDEMVRECRVTHPVRF